MKLSKHRVIYSFLTGLMLAVTISAQGSRFSVEDLKPLWEEFNAQYWNKLDFSKTVLKRGQIAQYIKETPDHPEDSRGLMGPEIDELSLLRGIIFGKRGRVFQDRNIQIYLENQSWYRPDPGFSNSVLSDIEMQNLDLIRLAEAEGHFYVEPGDLRLWQSHAIPKDRLIASSLTSFRILTAEIEAIHGKRFDSEPWLQTYFDDRYWYRPDPLYDPSKLNDFERSNLETLISMRSEGRNKAVSIGDMDAFQKAVLTREMLEGLTLNELRLIRNEFFARRGFRFSTPGIAQYFDWRDWYRPVDDNASVRLNEIEKQNVNLIENEERRIRNEISRRKIDAEMLVGFFIEDLRTLRNEIYAKRGRVFKDPELQDYFARQSWYKPDPDFDDSMLTRIELENLKIIKEEEEIAVSRFLLVEG